MNMQECICQQLWSDVCVAAFILSGMCSGTFCGSLLLQEPSLAPVILPPVQ